MDNDGENSQGHWLWEHTEETGTYLREYMRKEKDGSITGVRAVTRRESRDGGGLRGTLKPQKGPIGGP